MINLGHFHKKKVTVYFEAAIKRNAVRVTCEINLVPL